MSVMSSISMKHCSLDIPPPKQRALANFSAAQVSFSDWPFSIHLSVRPSLWTLFSISSSSLEPLGQFQPIFAQSILWERDFNCFQMKTITQSPPFSMGDNRKLKILLKVCWKEKPIHFPQCDNNKIAKIHWQRDYIGYEPILKFLGNSWNNSEV